MRGETVFHMICSASMDATTTTVHLTVREALEDGEWHTIAASGVVIPHLHGGLFPISLQELADEFVREVPLLIAKVGNTGQ